MRIRFQILLLIAVTGFGQFNPGDTLNLVFVGGQSNVLNLHADADLLPPSDLDTTIGFYYHTGFPPDHIGHPVLFFATSDSSWTTLQVQHQDPYIGLFDPYFGPEMTIGRTLAEYGIQNVGIFKIGYAGSHLAHDWKKGDHSMGDIYDLLLDQLEIATDSLTSRDLHWNFLGMTWMQGESDASQQQWAEDYADNLTEFIANIRADFEAPELPVALGQIADGDPFPFDLTVRAGQQAVAEADSRIDLIDLDDLPMEADRVHFTGPGVIEMGHRMANSLLALNGHTPAGTDHPITPDTVLLRAYPNPFNSSVVIQYESPGELPGSLSIYSLEGALIVQKTILPGDTPSFTWDGSDADGSALPSGLYLIRLQVESRWGAEKILLLR